MDGADKQQQMPSENTYRAESLAVVVSSAAAAPREEAAVQVLSTACLGPVRNGGTPAMGWTPGLAQSPLQFPWNGQIFGMRDHNPPAVSSACTFPLCRRTTLVPRPLTYKPPTRIVLMYAGHPYGPEALDGPREGHVVENACAAAEQPEPLGPVDYITLDTPESRSKLKRKLQLLHPNAAHIVAHASTTVIYLRADCDVVKDNFIPQVVECSVEVFAKFMQEALSHLRFVFLSMCSGERLASLLFESRFAEAVIFAKGDLAAVDVICFADFFYRALFGGFSVGESVMQATDQASRKLFDYSAKMCYLPSNGEFHL